MITDPPHFFMNKTDRLFAIILELQASGQCRAEDLAQTFEVNKRTIYRDVQALSEMGVPVVAVPGQGYSLMEGYFLPPLRFTTDEAVMLLLGSDFVAQNFDAQYRAAARSASRKLESILPDALREEVQYLQGSIRFARKNDMPEEQEDVIRLLRRAIVERKTIRFDYFSRSGKPQGQLQERTADPYGIYNLDGIWYLIAHDHARRDRRNFRVQRMERVRLGDKTFARPKGFVMEQDDTLPKRRMVIRALFDPEIARWVREANYFYATEARDTRDGLLVTLRVREPEDAVQWLLGWGSKVRILEPESLRATLQQEVERMLENYS